MHYIDAIKTYGEKAWQQLHKNATNNIEQVREAAPQSSSSYTASNHPSRKLSKLDEPDMRDIAGEVGTSSSVMYSCGPLNMDVKRQNDQLEPTYSSSV